MIAAQEDATLTAAKLDQQLDYATRIRAAVDIVADEDTQYFAARMRGNIGVDCGEFLLQQIGAAVNVADRVDPHTVRRTKSGRNGLC